MPVPKEIEVFKRSAWKPIVIESDGSTLDSKFAGTPFIKAGEDYPLCANCGEPLQLFLQLDLDKLPSALSDEFGRGLLQFFTALHPNRCAKSIARLTFRSRKAS